MKIKSYHSFIILVMMTLVISCNDNKDQSQPVSISDKKEHFKSAEINTFLKDSLAYELCQIYGLDQGMRKSGGFENKMLLVQSVDSFNFKRIIKFIKENGLPNKELLGKERYSQECVQGAFGAVMLHNPHMIVNNEEYLDFFVDLVESDELESQTLALILDKYYWAKSGGKSVLYGSQFGKPCLETKEQTNIARQKIGLKPLEDLEFQDCSSS